MNRTIINLWNRRIRNRTYGGVRGPQENLICFPAPYSIQILHMDENLFEPSAPEANELMSPQGE